MNIRFGGITEYTGPTKKVKAHMDSLQAADITNMTAHSDFNGSRAAVLSGKDTDRFLKETYDLEIPAEMKGKSQAAAQLLIAANPETYAPLIEKFTEMASDVFDMLDKFFAYVDARKAEGQDAEGNAIKQETIK